MTSLQRRPIIIAVTISIIVVSVWVLIEGNVNDWHDIFAKKSSSYYLRWAAGLSFSGIFLFLWRFIQLRVTNSPEYDSLWSELKYVFSAKTAIIFAIAANLLLTGITFLVVGSNSATINNVLSNNFASLLGLWISVFAFFLLIRAFFDRVGPIHRMDKLLVKVTEDLNSASKKGSSKALFCFPALNIGHFRNGEGQIYQEYRKAMLAYIASQNTDFTAITYGKDLYHSLYTCYSKVNSGLSKPTSVKECVDGANALLIAAEHGDTNRHIEISPKHFPPFVILIDDVVYAIQSFGLPVFKEENGNLTFEEPYSASSSNYQNLAELIVFRDVNQELTNLIRERIDKIIYNESQIRHGTLNTINNETNH